MDDASRKALWSNIANILDRSATYYRAGVGDRLSNIHDLTDAIMLEADRAWHERLQSEAMVEKMKALKYSDEIIARSNQTSRGAMEAENLAVDECIAVVRAVLAAILEGENGK